MVRVNLAEELELAEQGVLLEGSLVRTQLERVMESLEQHDVEIAAQVISDDDRVDDTYLSTEARVLNLIALQAPVAGDLRLVSALLHCNLHLERVGDLCVNIAKFVRNRHAYPSRSQMMTTLLEMGHRAGDMLDVALTALRQRSVELAEELPLRDDRLDDLNRTMLEQLKEYLGDEDSFEWALGLVLVARYLERIGDHAVDIGEQTSFLVTGVFREFTDASHPLRTT